MLLGVAAWLLTPPADAYSVLSHEALVDAAWDSALLPRLRERFPGASEDELKRARAFAYGGCVIQDMGYYPYGNRLFTDLTHYVRTGAFVSALVAEAVDLDEYAFALGAAGHYTGDGNGHAMGTNLVVPLAYPRLRRKYGDVVAYAEDPLAHVRVEFGFDVVQVAAGRYHSPAYMDFIGFEVATPLLQRAFRRTYGLEMKDLFSDLDRAVGSYRRAVSRLIPELTRVAWRRKQDEIRRLDPQAREASFVFALPTSEYRRRFGVRYQEPGVLARLVTFFARIVPKVGPLKLLVPKLPTREGERLFRESFAVSLEDYRGVLEQVGKAGIALQNINLDLGPPARAGDYRLADDAYSSLLLLLSGKGFAAVPPALRQDILTFYGDLSAPIATKQDGERWRRTLHALEELRAAPPPSAGSTAPPANAH
ncbi:MAG TPA: zinc dependent phospholipase C family protein [Vicinamibacteria bacterium]